MSIKVSLATKQQEDSVKNGITVKDKNDTIIYEDYLKVVGNRGTSKNSIELLIWGLARIRTLINTGTIELEEGELISIELTNKNLFKWLEWESVPKQHLNEFTKLQVEIEFFPYPLQFVHSKAPAKEVKYTSVETVDTSKGNNFTSFFSQLGKSDT